MDEDPVLHLWFKFLRIAIHNLIFLWFLVVSLVSVVGVYLWLQNDLSKPIPLPSSLCNVIYIQKDVVRGNAYMEKQQTYSRDEIYIYQYLGLLRRMLHERSQSDWNQMSHLLPLMICRGVGHPRTQPHPPNWSYTSGPMYIHIMDRKYWLR